MKMIKLILQILFPIFILIQPVYSQNDQDKSKKNNLPPIEYNIKSTPLLWFNNNDHLLLSNKIPITGLGVKYPDYSVTSLINFNRIMHQDFDYNYLSQPEIMRNQPLIHDFNKSNTDRLFDNFTISGSSIKSTYVGLGEYSKLGIGLKWNPYSKLSVDVGSFFIRQYNFRFELRSDLYGINTKTNYDLTDKLQFNIYGQYIESPRSNFFKGNILFPNSNIGSSLLYKVKKQTQIELGVKYQYYEFKNIWDIGSVSKISFGF